MRVNAYLTITGILFGIMAIVHVLRLLTGWPAMLGAWQVSHKRPSPSSSTTYPMSTFRRKRAIACGQLMTVRTEVAVRFGQLMQAPR